MAKVSDATLPARIDMRSLSTAMETAEPPPQAARLTPVAAIAQGLIYAAIVYGMLYAIATISHRDFTTHYQAFGLLSALMAFMGMRHFSLMTPWNLGRPNSDGNRLLMVWAGIVSVLLFVAYVAKFSAFFSRQVLLLWFTCTPAVLLLLNVGARALARRTFPDFAPGRRAVLIFANDRARRFAQSAQRSHNFEVLGLFDERSPSSSGGALDETPYLGSPGRVADYVRDNEVAVVFIFLSDGNTVQTRALLEALGDTTASIYCVPDLDGFATARMTSVEAMPMVEVAETPIYGVDGLLKQFIDRAAAFCALAVLGLPMALVALLIKLGSKGPVLFKQRRYGLNGREFSMYKFRSMVVDGDSRRADTLQATRDDPRITPIGRVLRRTSIDELPQLINILKGEMSLVGPRPHTVAHNEFYRQAVRRYMVRHKVRPGLTGLAQVEGFRGETAQLELMEKRVQLDIEYIQNWSIVMDMQILLRTVVVVLRGNNAW